MLEALNAARKAHREAFSTLALTVSDFASANASRK
jgi:hypothetical protein